MKLRKVIGLGLAISLFGGIAAYAATPAEIYSDVKGITVEEAYTQKGTDKTFGQLAAENGVSDEFKQKMLEDKKEKINQKVKDGIITQEKADEFIKQLEENVKNCDPSNPARLGQKLNMRFGNGNGKGKGMGQGNGQGRGLGRGMGQGRMNGSCVLNQQ